MIDFSTVKNIVIPEGEVAVITRGAEILWQKLRLPPEFQEVEYIASTGKQYLDLAYSSGNNIKYEVVASIQETQASSTYKGFLGTSVAPSARCGMGFYNGKIRVQFGSGGAVYDTNYHDCAYTQYGNKTTYTLSKSGFYINDRLEWTPKATLDTSTGLSIWLFNTHAESLYDGALLKVYSFKVWNSNTMVRNLIPCYRKSDGEAGFYDLVNQVFYTNAGTGEFYCEKPKYKTELAYLESTGTQWIDTGYRINNNSEIELVIDLLGSNSCDVFGSRASKSSANTKNVSVTTGTSALIVVDFTNSNYAAYRASSAANSNNCKAKIVINKNERSVMNLDTGAVLASNKIVCNDVFICDTNAYLLHVSGQPFFAKATEKAKVYYLKIAELGSLVRDFIPVLDWSDRPCMYDKVSGELFYNAGSGEFLYELKGA